MLQRSPGFPVIAVLALGIGANTAIFSVVSGMLLINAAMARRYFPGEDPVGKLLDLWGTKGVEIIGVVGDAVMIAACILPARRATKVDPIEALRYE